jgi:hypothetical protein
MLWIPAVRLLPAVVVTGDRGGGSVHLRRGNEVEDVEPFGEECGMRSLVLGAFIFASLGLTANAAEPPSGAKAVGVQAKRACQVVTADRALRLLRDTVPGDRRIAADRPVSRPVSSRPVTPIRTASRLAPVRFVSRAEPVRLLTQHLSLMVGIGY